MMPSKLNTDKLRGEDIIKSSSLNACPECDLLIDTSEQVKEGHVSECPRCSYTLEHPVKLSIRHNFFCVIIGLIFYFPAMLLPIMNFTMIGTTRAMSILDALRTLVITGNMGIASLFLITLVLIPLLKMILIIFITTRLYYHAQTHYLAASFKWYHAIKSWGMLDIFMLSLLVAAIKLSDDAELLPGLGLYAFVTLLLSSALQTQLLNKKLLWRLIERHGN